MNDAVPSLENLRPPRILLGQLGANGDCLNATTLARQIKHDYPNCHLTWAVSSPCRGMVENNPDVDEIWEFVPNPGEAMPSLWQRFEAEVRERVRQHQFDEVFLSQIYPNNFQNYDGTTRPSTFRAYPQPITVPVGYTLRLYEWEVEKVREFARKHQLALGQPTILFECSSKSGQSFVTPYYAIYAAQLILSRHPQSRIILSSHVEIPALDERIIDGSQLTLRENAELTKYCSLFVGCSSGVTLTTLTDWAKPLPKILLLRSQTSMYASIVHEFEHWGLPVDSLLEMWDTPVEQLVECVSTVITKGFPATRGRFHQDLKLDFNYYFSYLEGFLLKRNEYAKVACSLLHAVERYGWHSQLKLFVQTELIPRIEATFSLPSTEEEYQELLLDLAASLQRSETSVSCKVCQSESYPFARAKILGRHEIDYFQCSNCGFVQTEEPYWLEEAYAREIARTDVGLVKRNLTLSVPTKLLISNFFNSDRKFLDYGGGYGLFVRLLRDTGFDFYWLDKYCQNIFAEGFEVERAGDTLFELATAFEVFEHLVEPSREIESLLRFSRNILFSTELLPESNPRPHEWWYYALEGGQHISIYTLRSLALMAERFGLNLYSDGSGLHLLTEKELPQDLFEQLQQGNLTLASRESLIPGDYDAAVRRMMAEQVGVKEPDEKALSNLNLREINWIIFPDWQQPEEDLIRILGEVFKAVALHPDRDRATLLIDTTGISAEDAGLILSGIAMSLLMEEEIDVSESAEISLLEALEPLQWKRLRRRLQGKIVLEAENGEAIAKADGQTLTGYNLDEFAAFRWNG